MKIIEQEEVRKLLQPKDCIQLMAEALKGLESGEYAQPARLITVMPNTAKFGFMPAYVGDYFGAKVISAFAPNMGTKYPSHIGYVMLFESAHSTVAGMIEAGSITEIRDITSVTVYDLFPQAAERFAKDMQEKYKIPVVVCSTVKEAVKDADIICTVTPSKEPLLTKEMVKPGTHINAVGTFTPTTREVSSDLVAAARLYSDQTEAAKRESGEYLIPLKEGLIKEDHIVGSIGEVLLGKAPGRTADDEITIFDALGLAIEDVASAKYVYERAAL